MYLVTTSVTHCLVIVSCWPAGPGALVHADVPSTISRLVSSHTCHLHVSENVLDSYCVNGNNYDFYSYLSDYCTYLLSASVSDSLSSGLWNYSSFGFGSYGSDSDSDSDSAGCSQTQL